MRSYIIYTTGLERFEISDFDRLTIGEIALRIDRSIEDIRSIEVIAD